jgi:hypothetical protein
MAQRRHRRDGRYAGDSRKKCARIDASVRIGTKVRRQDFNRNRAVKPRVSPVTPRPCRQRPAETEPHKAPASFRKRVPAVSRNYSRPATGRTLAATTLWRASRREQPCVVVRQQVADNRARRMVQLRPWPNDFLCIFLKAQQQFKAPEAASAEPREFPVRPVKALSPMPVCFRPAYPMRDHDQQSC